MQQNKPTNRKKISYTVDFKQTFLNLKAAVEKLVVVVPPTEEGKKPTTKRLIKGNVYGTLKDIYRLHMMTQRKSDRKGPIALRTKNPSIARVTRNSERTIQRHIELLIKHGLIQAKARLGHGIQLLLDAALIAYKETTYATIGKDAPVYAPTVAPAALVADTKQLLADFASRFTSNRGKSPLSPS